LGKNVSAATNTHAAIEEFVGKIFLSAVRAEAMQQGRERSLLPLQHKTSKIDVYHCKAWTDRGLVCSE
jgi:hypothetical protein